MEEKVRWRRDEEPSEPFAPCSEVRVDNRVETYVQAGRDGAEYDRRRLQVAPSQRHPSRRTETKVGPAPSPSCATVVIAGAASNFSASPFYWRSTHRHTPAEKRIHQASGCDGRGARRTAPTAKADHQYLTAGPNTGHVNAHARQRLCRVPHAPVRHVKAETTVGQRR